MATCFAGDKGLFECFVPGAWPEERRPFPVLVVRSVNLMKVATALPRQEYLVLVFFHGYSLAHTLRPLWPAPCAGAAQNQSSTFSLGTRANSRVLCVTRTALWANAVPAIKVSRGPMGVPFLSSCARIDAAALASLREKGTMETTETNCSS